MGKDDEGENGCMYLSEERSRRTWRDVRVCEMALQGQGRRRPVQNTYGHAGWQGEANGSNIHSQGVERGHVVSFPRVTGDGSCRERHHAASGSS